jgi:hypothetical protein
MPNEITYPVPQAKHRPRERVEITIPVVISYDNEEARSRAIQEAIEIFQDCALGITIPVGDGYEIDLIPDYRP